MAATTSNAIKAFLESVPIGVSVYRDRAPANLAPPYITVAEAVAVTTDPSEDGVAGTVHEQAVDAYRRYFTWDAIAERFVETLRL